MGLILQNLLSGFEFSFGYRYVPYLYPIPEGLGWNNGVSLNHVVCLKEFMLVELGIFTGRSRTKCSYQRVKGILEITALIFSLKNINWLLNFVVMLSVDPCKA